MSIAASQIGKRFGQLLVVGIAHERTAATKKSRGTVYMLCRCDCGNEIEVILGSLRRTKLPTRMCRSCAAKKAGVSNAKHGALKTPEYRAWSAMKDRCYRPSSDQAAAAYRDRGITVCDEWRHDFLAFLRDVGPRPSPSHTIDRIDVNGHYEPSNVRWATKEQQMGNRRCTIFAMWRGQWTPLADIARELNIAHARVYHWARGYQRPRGTPLEHMEPIIRQSERKAA